MGQEEILKLLKKAKKPLTADEISNKLNIGRSSVNTSLRKLVRQGEIKLIEEPITKYSSIKKYRYMVSL